MHFAKMSLDAKAIFENVANGKPQATAQMSSRLPNLLISNELISQEQFLIFKSRQKDSGNTVITELTKLGVISEDQIAQFISNYYSLELVDLEKTTGPEPVLQLITKNLIKTYKYIPISGSAKSNLESWVDPSIDYGHEN